MYPESNFKSISDIHPESPLYTLKVNVSKTGMTHMIKLFCYDHIQDCIVDISELTAANMGKTPIKGALKLSGTGANMLEEMASDFKHYYHKVATYEYRGKHTRTNMSEVKFMHKEMAEFLELKENKLRFAPPVKQNDFKFVHSIVKECGSAVKYASTRLKNNNKIALAALRHDGYSLKYLGDKIKDNELFVYLAVQKLDTAHLLASKRISEKIGPQDANNYLKSYLLNEKLTDSLSNKEKETKKIKI